MAYWLMKSEPDAFSIDDLKNMPDGTDHWDGIRNYQARNFMRDDMKKGDRVFFYHSNTKEPGIVGIMKVTSEAYPDHTALDPDSPYYDPKATEADPRWQMVDVTYERHLDRTITLSELKDHADQLEDFTLIRRGNRLSIMPVAPEHWDYILGLE